MAPMVSVISGTGIRFSNSCGYLFVGPVCHRQRLSASVSCKLLVELPTCIDVFLRLLKQMPGVLRFALAQHSEAVLEFQIIGHWYLGRGRIDVKRILTF